MNDTFRVRDYRRKEMFRVDDAIADVYAKKIGITPLIVYLYLCRHADRNQESFPSQEYLADKIGVSRRTIIRAVQTLERWNLISVFREYRKGTQTTHNTYTLLDKGVWNKEASDKSVTLVGWEASDISDQKQVTFETEASDTHVTLRKHIEGEKHIEGWRKAQKKSVKSKINGNKFTQLGAEVIKAFEAVDPKNKRYYNNTTQRSASDFLVAEYGLERVLQAIKMLPVINQKKLYLRQITTPHELQENWVKIGNALKQEESTNKSKIAF